MHMLHTTTCLLVAIFVLLGCETAKLTELPVYQLDQFKYRKESKGVFISVDPIVERDRSVQLFGDNLLNYRILPILIHIRNTGDKTIHIKLGLFSLKGHDDNNKATENMSAPLQKKQENMKKVENYVLLGAALGTPVFGFPVLPIIVLGAIVEHHAIDMSTIEANIQRKAILEKYLYKNESYEGFIYFHVGDNYQVGNASLLSVKIIDKDNLELDTMEFNIK